ncbi:hypothetical protein [Methanopyrus sp.]
MPKVVGYDTVTLKVAKLKCSYTGDIFHPILYVIPACPETPFWSKVMAVGAVLALAAIVIMAVQTFVRASKINDSARQVLSAGILTTVAGVLTILVDMYRHVVLAPKHLIIKSYMCHEVVAAAGTLMGVGGAMVLLGLALTAYRKLTL